MRFGLANIRRQKQGISAPKSHGRTFFAKIYPLAFVIPILGLTSCGESFNEHRALQFQSLSKNQQAAYWEAKKIQYDTSQLQKKGIFVFNVGDEYRIIIPANLLFINAKTPALTSQSHQIFEDVVKLINNQSTPSISVLAYVNPSVSPQRDYALSQSWADTVATYLRDNGLGTALVTATGMGRCDNVGSGHLTSQRIELRYRVDHED